MKAKSGMKATTGPPGQYGRQQKQVFDYSLFLTVCDQRREIFSNIANAIKAK
jgi:hypothetical protein